MRRELCVRNAVECFVEWVARLAELPGCVASSRARAHTIPIAAPSLSLLDVSNEGRELLVGNFFI